MDNYEHGKQNEEEEMKEYKLGILSSKMSKFRSKR